jgi:hypothetical protein
MITTARLPQHRHCRHHLSTSRTQQRCGDDNNATTHLVLTLPSRPQRQRGDNDDATIAAPLSTHHDRDCHGGIVTTCPLVLTVTPAWRAPRPHPALGVRAAVTG